MTKHTARDFAAAEFARRKDGRIAARTEPHYTVPWEDHSRRYTDAEMAAASGWSIVRDAESLTAREHLELAWEAAIAPEDGMIRAGEWFLAKGPGDALASAYGPARNPRTSGVPGRYERRLLEPHAPAWHRAQIIRAWRDDDQDSVRWARMDSGRWVCLDGESAGIECEPVGLRDVTVIVGAEQ